MRIKNLLSGWKKYFQKPYSWLIILLTLLFLVVVLSLFAKFLVFVEARPGVVLPDPLFKNFEAMDFNTPIFIFIYGSLLTGLISLIPYPKYLILALQTYTLMVVFRFAAMYLTPLNVPEGIINLRDPLVFTIGTGEMVTKDLFFSGHLASLVILFLTAQNKFLKWMFLVFAVIVGTMIFIQKAHYTIDLLTAPFFAFAAFTIAKKINNLLFQNANIE